MTMRLEEVTVENFGPYYGAHSLRFGRNRPIVLVHGDNMRGKTSLMNSVRWVLYGTVQDRRGRPISRANLLNRDAAVEHNWTMSVTLDLEIDGTEYRLNRLIQPKRGVTRPQADSDFDEKIFMKRGHYVLSEDDTERELNRMLPVQVSRFFLFDGELLNEYERLLGDPDREAEAIKKSIEDILGVPALSHAIVDLKANQRDAQRRQQRLASKDQAAMVFAAEAARLTAEIDVLEGDLDGLNKIQDGLLSRQKDLEEALQAYADVEGDVRVLKEHNATLKRLADEEEQLLAERREKLAEAWRDFLYPRVAPRLAAAEAEREQQEMRLQEAAALRAWRDQWNTIAGGEPCPICGQPSSAEGVAQAEQERDELDQAIANLQFDPERWQRARDTSHRLQRVSQVGAMDTVISIEARLRRNRVEVQSIALERDTINARLREVDHAAVSRNRQEHEDVTKELGALEKTIDDKAATIKTKSAERDKNHTFISQRSGPELARLNREVQLYREMVALFERARERLRDALREQVERDASAIFRQLTTDKSYKGLRINDHYGLTIVDVNDRDVAVRSAGAEQVVALSLIGALNQNAVRRGAIIMDTPFGRLDPKHRENILRFIPTMAEQVTLLVHGGEVDRQRDLSSIRDKIDREYTIEYVSSNRSRLTAANGDTHE